MRPTLLLLALVGCGSDWQAPRADPFHAGDEWLDARDAVWSFYGHRDVPPPLLPRGPGSLDCKMDPGGSGWAISVDDGNGQGWLVKGGEAGEGDWVACIAGNYWPGLGWIQVATYDGAIRNDTLPHELWHAHLHRVGISDHGHTDPGFQPGGAVEQAQAALR